MSRFDVNYIIRTGFSTSSRRAWWRRCCSAKCWILTLFLFQNDFINFWHSVLYGRLLDTLSDRIWPLRKLSNSSHPAISFTGNEDLISSHSSHAGCLWHHFFPPCRSNFLHAPAIRGLESVDPPIASTLASSRAADCFKWLNMVHSHGCHWEIRLCRVSKSEVRQVQY